jgi:hypothetical protein
MSKQAKLKPCPCCGDDGMEIALDAGDIIRCMTCGLQTAICTSLRRAIAAWNRRASRSEGKEKPR